jgi:3-oxoacyl-[acyl-carrier-protein] synthase II
MKEPQVVVSGVGAVSALALDHGEHFRRLLAGDSGVGRFSGPEHRSLTCRLEARVRGFDRRRLIDNRMLRKILTSSATYAVAAGGHALRDAGLLGDREDLQRCGLYVGSVCVDLDPEIFLPAVRESLRGEGDLDAERFATRGLLLIDPLFLVKSLPNGGLGGIAIEYQVLGPNLNITNGTASGLQAVAAAAAAIRCGATEVALAGGYDSLFGMDSIAEHLLAERLSPRDNAPAAACRPFSLDRCGYVLGEGAVFFVLETAERARRRSARVYGHLLGAGHATEPDGWEAGRPCGLADAARAALAGCGCDGGEVDAIFGDGLAVEVDDLREADAARLLGATGAWFSAGTPALGFTGSATGAFSLLHAVLSAQAGVVPPTINCAAPDPRCGLRLAHRPERQPLRRILVWSSDRGLKNVAVVVGAP